MEILLFQEQAKLGDVLDLVFSPDDGSVLGILVHDPILKKTRFIVSTEIRRVVGGRILASGYDSMEDVDDLIRVKEAIAVGAKILGETVETQGGQRLGRVSAATVDMAAWRLSRLYVDSFFGVSIISKQLLIPANKIIRIEKKKIIVGDDFAKARHSAVAPVVGPALD